MSIQSPSDPSTSPSPTDAQSAGPQSAGIVATVENLRAALSAVRRRRSLLALLHQSSLVIIGIAGVVLLLSLISLWLPDNYVLQLMLFAGFIVLAAILLWRYFRSLSRLRADDQQLAQFVESRMPDLEQRLLTSLEFSNDVEAAKRAGVSAQFVEQLWVDAEEHLREQHVQLEQVSDARTPLLSLSVAGVAALVTVVAFISSESLLRAGAQLFWPFSLRPVIVEMPVAELPAEPVELVISVEPGDIRMQRGRSASINVRVENGTPANVRMRMQSDQLNWYDVSMREEGSGSNGAAYSYYMPEVTDDLVYYVSIDDPAAPDGEQRTRQFSITLYDLPQAEQIDLAYTFPEYTGMENTAETDGGDMVVPEGTAVAMNVTFNKAVQQADIVFDDDTRVPLAVDGITGSASLTIDRDTGYRIVATDFDRLQTEDADIFYIRSIPDQPPVLTLRSPGRDQDVMPLEEVILEVDATDDYGLSEFMLHYSVVGMDEQAIDFLPQQQTREITGNQMIYMEDLIVQPGDFVSYYMTLADNNGLSGPQQIVSDIYFLQVVPTDQEFRRASAGQQGGGGGGGGGDNSGSALVTLQKDIIAATWRLRQQQLTMDQQQFSNDVVILAESQREAKERANMSIQRLSERLDFADDSYGNAVTYLQRAIEQMELAAVELDGQALTTAMQPEQQALQLVLRAEAEINRTDVNFQRQAGGGGGGGGGQQENEDLRELFEMEMGQNENRYETPRQAGGGQQQNTEESSRLEELARRQESLTRAQRNLARRMEDMEEEQRRRELERLRREQEQLSTELAQLQQQMNRRQQSQQAQNSQQSSQQASNQSGSSQSNSQMQRALEQMQEAAQADSPAQAAARSQRALESLREQQRQMAQQPENSANQLAQNLSQRGQQLIDQQRALQQQLQQLSQQQGLGQTRQEASTSEEVQDLVQQQERNRQELAEIERMLRAVIARASNEEQQLLSQAQQASRSLRNITEQMDTANRVLRNGMVNLAVDIEGEVADSLQQLGQNLQALGNGGQPPGQTSEDPVMKAAADASALRQELERLQQEIDAREAGQQGDTSIAEMREQLARSQQLAQQLAQQLDQAGQQTQGQQAGQRGQASQRGQQAQQLAQQGQAGQQPGQNQSQQPGQSQGQTQGQQSQQNGGSAGGQLAGGPVDSQQQQGLGGIPAPSEAALWGNARSISSEITRQSLEDFMNQPELLRGLLQPLIELESDLRARAELAQISRRLFTVSDEDIPDQYRQLVESYYRALSETGASSITEQNQAPTQ